MSEIPVALVTVRTSSGRLPNKCFLPLGGISVLEHVIRRVKTGGLHPIVCTSVDASDDLIENLATRLGVKFFRGDLENKLNRWKACMQEFGLDTAHIVDADDPYFDPIEMHESFELLTRTPLDLVLTSARSDSGFASVGTSIRLSFIKELVNRAAKLRSANFDVIPWDLLLRSDDCMTSMPDKNLGIPADVEFRLTLDYPEDYEMLAVLGNTFEYDVPRFSIEKHLLANPELAESNLFRNQDFLKNKQDFKRTQFQ